jgi:hypothetical protein
MTKCTLYGNIHLHFASIDIKKIEQLSMSVRRHLRMINVGVAYRHLKKNGVRYVGDSTDDHQMGHAINLGVSNLSV